MATGSSNKKLDFLRLSRQGTTRVRELSRKNATAVDLFLYLAENADMNAGAIAVDVEVLARELNCSDRHARRVIKILEDDGFIRRPAPSVFAINPADIWGGYSSSKNSSLYMTMDSNTAKRVRYVFNPKGTNTVVAKLGVEISGEVGRETLKGTPARNNCGDLDA